MDNHPGRGAFCPKPREPGTDPTRRRWALSRAPAVLGFVQVTRRLNHGPARQRGRPGRRAFSGHVQAQRRDRGDFAKAPRRLLGLKPTTLDICGETEKPRASRSVS